MLMLMGAITPGNAIAIDRGHQDRADSRCRDARFPIERRPSLGPHPPAVLPRCAWKLQAGEVCAFHRDPAKRHGPYLECTYKVHNETVNFKLYPEVAPL